MQRVEHRLATFSGAHAVRVIDPGGGLVPEHAHDWPVLSVFIAGGYRNACALGEADIAQPSAIFYRRGEAHANAVMTDGLEQIDIEFDPHWVDPGLAGRAPAVRRWIGGPAARAARDLVLLWAGGGPEERLRAVTRRFFADALTAEDPPRPVWIGEALRRLSGPEPAATERLACDLGLNRAWMAQAYRAAVGEGLRDTVRRRRVERAMRWLREPASSASDVACAAGFCDQSHMIRAFRHVLGRTPTEVRRDFQPKASQAA